MSKQNDVTITVGHEHGQLTTTLEVIKNDYICGGLGIEELASKYHLPIVAVQNLITENKLDALRAAHIKHGLAQLQNVQLANAEKLMTLENQFKKMRLIQIEKMLEDYTAYYAKHGHFYKVHPITGEVLNDTNGIPMQIRIPNVSNEIRDLKESVTLSEGLKGMLKQIDDIINPPEKDVNPLNDSTLDMKNLDGMFSIRGKNEED